MEEDWKTSGELVKKAFTRIEESYANRHAWPAGLPTGLRDFDDHFGGWARGGLSVVGGRPGAGKSSFLRTALLHAATSRHFSRGSSRDTAGPHGHWMMTTDAMQSIVEGERPIGSGQRQCPSVSAKSQ